MNLTVEFEFTHTKANNIHQSIKPEIEDQMRSQATLTCSGNAIKLLIQAEDIIAMRASTNSWLRLIKIACELSDPIL